MKDSNGKTSSVFTTSIATTNPTIADFCKNGDTLATCVKNFGNQGPEMSKIYIHNSQLTNGAGDNSYRYAGGFEEVNNFVCFGNSDNKCENEKLYRIIGVFDDKVKLIKYDYATSALLGSNGDFSKESDYKRARYYKGEQTISYLYHWNYNNDTTANNGKGSINWNTSLLNKINLNNNMLNNIGESWANKIATTNWIVGGNTWENINSKTAKEVYNNEIVNYSSVLSPTTYLAKIGLIYLSDYKYATIPEAWSETTVTIANRPWIYMGALYEYSITPNVQYNSIFNLDFVNLDPNAPASVRPVFSLLSSITYKSGNGTKDNPIFIN